QDTKIVQPGPADDAARGYFHTIHAGRLIHERSLDADAVAANAADLERSFGRLRSVRRDDDALEYLESLAAALDDPDVNPNGVTFGEIGQRLRARNRHQL